MAKLMGIKFTSITENLFITSIKRAVEDRRKIRVVTPNLNIARMACKDKEFLDLIKAFDYRFCDSQILFFLMKIIGNGVPSKMAGSDQSRMIFQRANEEKWRIALFGASKKTLNLLRGKYDFIVFSESPPVCEEPYELKENPDYIKAINSSNADILLVALGAKKQEMWVEKNWSELKVPVTMCVGAGLDFLSGEVRRAPVFFQKVGLEWFWRLCSEPTRLFSRYLKDGMFLFCRLPEIGFRILKSRILRI